MTSSPTADVIALIVGYLLGSIPFGLLLTGLTGGPDIRSIGSGNIGATNVLRAGNKRLAAATLLGDMLKGTAAVLIAKYALSGDAPLVAGLGAFLGHVFPVWLGFRGGKGVATYIGVLLGLAWPFAIGFGVVWITAAVLTRYSSLAGLIASALIPMALWWRDDAEMTLLFFVLSVLLWVTHRANIRRLLSGTESKIGSKG